MKKYFNFRVMSMVQTSFLTHRVSVLWWSALSFAFAFLLASSCAEAQEMPGIWLIERVAVDVSATDASEAQKQALIQGERFAFKKLLEEASCDPQIASQVSADQIHEWMIGFEVHQERTSARRYRASISYHFDRASVERWLHQKGHYPGQELAEAPVDNTVPVLPEDATEEEGPPPLSPLPSRRSSEQSPPTLMSLTVSFQTLYQWIYVWHELQKLTTVQHVIVETFAPQQGTLSFQCSGSHDRLKQSLHKISACVSEEDHQSFSLSCPDLQKWSLKFGA